VRQTLHYRPEIDGLRAIAVVAVLLFHLHLPNGSGYWFSGGFLGVDVFLVISGYLITSILLREQSGGTYSTLRFYERRARRILPALFAMLAVCLPLGWQFLLPHQYETMAKATVAAIFFGSNIFFWGEAGYFAAPTELDPLIHTWSLGVEEQFYIFFPIIVAAVIAGVFTVLGLLLRSVVAPVYMVTTVLLTIGVFIVGLYPAPLFSITDRVAAVLFS
jgi:peptidoglycan/LPS O-acetylase OafA/YrhL